MYQTCDELLRIYTNNLERQERHGPGTILRFEPRDKEEMIEFVAIMKGIFLARQEKYEEAQQEFEKAQDMDGKREPIATAGVGHCCFLDKDYRYARDMYRELVSGSPEDVDFTICTRLEIYVLILLDLQLVEIQYKQSTHVSSFAELVKYDLKYLLQLESQSRGDREPVLKNVLVDVERLETKPNEATFELKGNLNMLIHQQEEAIKNFDEAIKVNIGTAQKFLFIQSEAVDEQKLLSSSNVQ